MPSLLASLFLLIATVPAVCADLVLDNFAGDLSVWQPQMLYGDAAATRAQADAGQTGQALRVDFDLRAEGTNHILFARELRADLSGFESISFDVKGSGQRAELFLFLYDSRGRFQNYGPHGSNPDFHTDYADWHRLTVNLATDHTVQGGDLDFSDIARVGFFIWSSGPRKGTVWLDNLTAQPARPRLSVTPGTITPNGDGISDVAQVRVSGPPGSRVTLQALDPEGVIGETLLDAATPPGLSRPVAWAPRRNGVAVTGDVYTLRALFRGPVEEELRAEVRVVQRDPWPPISYTAEPFFPIGVWFEGAPSVSGCPDDPAGAKRYYDLCFADLQSHGFNAAAVPNCPPHLWETLLQSAGEHGIRICLEVGPLVALVSRRDPPTEEELIETARPIVERLSKYPALLRYQIRDEPPPDMVPNWILVQRILAALDPRHPAFSCFCDPNSLARMVAQTTASEVVFDIYPLHKGTPLQTLGGFWPSFEVFRRSAQGKPMWAVLQSFAVPEETSWRYPTPEELRAMTYLSLAGGAQGIFYFLYQYMPSYLWGLVEVKGQQLEPKHLYGETAKLAGELQKLSPLLLSLKAGEQIAAVEGEARVGSFVTTDGKRLLVIASLQPGREVAVKVSVPPASIWRNVISGERHQAQDGALLLGLAGGNGVVLVQD